MTRSMQEIIQEAYNEVPKIKPTLFFGMFVVLEYTFFAAFFSIILFDKQILKIETIKKNKNILKTLKGVFFFIYRVKTKSFPLDISSEKQ